MRRTHERVRSTIWRDAAAEAGVRRLAEETAVAISFNGSTHAVLMATPSDLEDLAIGFAFTERIIDGLAAVESIAIEEFDSGLDAQIRVHDEIAGRLAARRRSMAGPVGCGLCGLESLEAAARDLERVSSEVRFSPQDVTVAVRSMMPQQELGQITSATHAAGFFLPGCSAEFVREDVGRHNALDKVIGALLRAGRDPADGGLVVTSRVSVELVQKAAIAGSGLIAAVSAPTAFAIRAAEAANITVAAIVRGESFEVFGGHNRIELGTITDVA